MVRKLAVSMCLLAGCYTGASDGFAGETDGPGGGPAGGSGPESGGQDATGDGTDSGGSGSETDGPEGGIPGVTRMRRLTQAQYLQSTRDLLAIPEWTPTTALPDDGLNQEEFQLPNMVAATVTTTSLDYSRYRALAKEAVEFAFATDAAMVERLGCTPSGAEDSCLQDYVMTTAERAWSRPVDAADPIIGALFAIAADGEAELGDVRLGLQWAILSLIQTPEYLYFYPVRDANSPGAMDDYSKARSIALMFRDSVPDAQLIARARAGELSDEDTLRAEIDRLIDEMIAEPSMRGAVRRFFGEWWSMNVIDAIGKDPTAYPEFTESLRDAMKAEIGAWLDDILFDRRQSFGAVLVSDRLFVNDELAALYGIEGNFGPEVESIAIPENSPRSGLLTTAAFLSVMAHPALTSPAARGKFVSERLLCMTIPPPPPNVDTTIPPPEGPETKRERFARHTTKPTCAGCHNLMDPMGLALEEFDAIGRHQTFDTIFFEDEAFEVPLDVRGELGGVAFEGGRAMSDVIASNGAFIPCVTRQLLRQSLGREIEDGEGAALDDLVERFAASDHDFLSLMRETAMHDVFATFAEEN